MFFFLALVCLFVSAAQSSCSIFPCSISPGAIIDDSLLTFSIDYQGSVTSISSSSFTFQTFIAHTWSSDLGISITSPLGTVVLVVDSRGHDLKDLFLGTVWKDGAPNVATFPFSTNGVVSPLGPEKPFSNFDGEDPRGVWTITIADLFSGDHTEVQQLILDVEPIPTTQPPTTQPPTTQPPQPCDSFPCLNAGTCTNVDSSTFSCSCPSGFSGDTCEFAGPIVNLDITTASKLGSGTTDEILVTFVGSTGTSGPHSLGSVFGEDGGLDQITGLQLFGDIGELQALDLVNVGQTSKWRVDTIEVTGDLTGSFGKVVGVKDTRTLEAPLTFSYQTKNGVDDGCAGGVYIKVIDEFGKAFTFLLFSSTNPGDLVTFDYPYLNLGSIKKIQLGSFTEDTWDFDFINITRRGVTHTFTNTIGQPFSRAYHLAQFLPQ